MAEFRLDFSRLQSSKVQKTAGGGFRVPAGLTRTGVFVYHNADGSTRRELRLPEEVFKADSIQSLRDAPVVEGHPSMIDADNWEKHAVGHVSGDAKQDGTVVAGDIVISRKSTQAKVDSGALQELSCGYTCNFDATPGEWEGEQYDGIQREITYNHVGLGPQNWARAGNVASLRLDGGYASFPADARDVPSTPLETPKMKIVFDGKEYDKGSDEHVNAMQAKVDSQSGEIKSLTSAKEKAEGRADAAEQAAKDTQVKLDGALSPERVDALVAARVDLVVAATKVLGTNVKFDGKSDREIMTEVVKVTHPEQAKRCDEKDAAGKFVKSDAYVEALFEAGVASGKRVDSISNFDSALETAQRQDLEIPEPAGHSRAEDSKKPLQYSKGGK